jgi:hypothetical protein
MTDDAAKEMRLFQEIKQAKDRVQELYRQMNRNPGLPNDDVSGTEEAK